MRRRPASASVVASLALLVSVTGCAGTGGAASTGRPVRLPSLMVLDVNSGRQVRLSAFQPRGNQPLLVWAWAPYCPYCRREAPAVEQFARLHRNDLRVVGVGTQNTATEARAFRRQTGIRSFPLLYEAHGFRSWKPFGFSAQPAAALLSSHGRLLRVWSGPFDEAEVLRLIAT